MINIPGYLILLFSRLQKTNFNSSVFYEIKYGYVPFTFTYKRLKNRFKLSQYGQQTPNKRVIQ